MTTDADIEYMMLALSLAERGWGAASPNPMVGAVVVSGGRIVGRGWHERAGGDHAEVVALREAGPAARGATLYVTLEPCCHYGKTPPCVDTLITSGISRVVAAMTDPNPRVCGTGFSRLRGHGIEVETGFLEEQAEKLNEAYIKHIRTGVPFLTLKLAITLDGKIAAADGTSRWVTGPEARTLVHRMRTRSDAVMVGAGTVIADDPLLTAREVEGRNPLRVVADSRLRTEPSARVYEGGAIVAVSGPPEPSKEAAFAGKGVEIWRLEGADGKVDLAGLLSRLGERGITSVLCEGGGGLASGLLRVRLVDKVVLFIAPLILGAGVSAVDDIGIGTMTRALKMKDVEIDRIGDDVLVTGYPIYG